MDIMLTEAFKRVVELMEDRADLKIRVNALEKKLFLLEQNYATLYKRVVAELGEDPNALNF